MESCRKIVMWRWRHCAAAPCSPLVGDESAIRGFFDARPGVHDLTILQHTAETVDLTVRLDGTSSEDVVAGLIGAGFRCTPGRSSRGH